MRFKKISYLIHDKDLGSRKVTGYAVESAVPVRFCVRKVSKLYWKVDHFDSGLCVGQAWGPVRSTAAAHGERVFSESLKNGAYKHAMDQLNKR